LLDKNVKRVRSLTVREGYIDGALIRAKGRKAEVALPYGQATDTLRVFVKLLIYSSFEF
jgi:hypothetical protein